MRVQHSGKEGSRVKHDTKVLVRKKKKSYYARGALYPHGKSES
jgi:hypothetical protein